MKIDNSERGFRLAQSAAASIQGSAGSTTAFNLISGLTVGLLLSDSQALDVLESSGWNARCLPPWSHRELIDKIRRSRTESRREPGYMLKPDERHTAPAGRANKPASLSPSVPAPPLPHPPEKLEEMAKDRLLAGPLRDLTGKEKGQIASSRSLTLASVEIGAQNRLVMADDAYPGHYVLTDRLFRQRRKIDDTVTSCGAKSQNYKGFPARGFFCQFRQFANLEKDDLLFLVEGAIGLLECLSIQWLCAPLSRRWHFLAAHSKSSRFFFEPEILQAITGHHVRILPDPGNEGIAAARAWRDELRAVGCRLDFATMPDGFQDLRKILETGSHGVPAMRSILAYPATTKQGGAA